MPKKGSDPFKDADIPASAPQNGQELATEGQRVAYELENNPDFQVLDKMQEITPEMLQEVIQ